MNSTNRAMNRIVIVIVGTFLLACGLVAVGVGAVASVRDAWRVAVPQLARTARAWVRSGADSADTAVAVAIVAALVILIVLLIVFIFRQGRGHTSRLMTDATTDHGSTIIESGLAEQLVQDALADRPELLATRVSTYRVRRASVLKISVVARRGASPRDIGVAIDNALHALDAVVGVQIPAAIHIGGGLRTRMTTAARLS